MSFNKTCAFVPLLLLGETRIEILGLQINICKVCGWWFFGNQLQKCAQVKLDHESPSKQGVENFNKK